VRLAKPTIGECAMLNYSLPLQDVPPKIEIIICSALQESPDIIQSYWQLIKNEIRHGHWQDGLGNAAACTLSKW